MTTIDRCPICNAPTEPHCSPEHRSTPCGWLRCTNPGGTKHVTDPRTGRSR